MLTGGRAADDDVRDLRPAHLDEPLEVEGVQRLTELVEDEVGDIHHVVDRAQPDRTKALAEPCRRWADDHPFDHASREPRAPIRVLDPDPGTQLRRGGREECIRHRRRRLAERLAQRGGELACDADVAQAIGPVGGDVEVEDRVHGERFGKRLSWRPFLEDENAVRVLPHAELDCRAEHAR